MHVKATQYKDTWAAPGSALYAALEAKDYDLADYLYHEAYVEYLRWNGTPEQYAKQQVLFNGLVKKRAEKAAAEAAQLIAGKKK
jgi:hypothetical protein